MNIKILRLADHELVKASINGAKDNKKIKLPTVHEGWRFNFNKHAKAKDAHTYVLVTEDTPEIIEGCLVYKMLEPYMAYIEIAPHNKGEHKRYDLVAGCLIAFSCRLSFILGKGAYSGWLAFDVHEPTEEDQQKLMSVYSKKYKAQRFDKTSTMLIAPEDGESLIEEYLKN